MKAMETTPTCYRDLEDAWRLRVEMEQDSYRTAVARYGRLMKEFSGEHSRDHPGSAITAAREAATQALREYARVLGIFTALTVDKKLPQETIGRKAAGA